MSRLACCRQHLPAPVRKRRLESVMAVYFTLLAEHERRCDGTGLPAPCAEQVDDFVVMVAGLLTTPTRTRD